MTRQRPHVGSSWYGFGRVLLLVSWLAALGAAQGPDKQE